MIYHVVLSTTIYVDADNMAQACAIAQATRGRVCATTVIDAKECREPCEVDDDWLDCLPYNRDPYYPGNDARTIRQLLEGRS